MTSKTFGKNPDGQRLEKIKQSPNYKNDIFQNLSQTEVMLPGASMGKMLREYFNKSKLTEPPKRLPSVKTDLKNIQAETPSIVWFGHSSYLIKSNNFTILVDPVFSGNASPISLFGKSFEGSDIYNPSDFPVIDLLIITHDHYDHLDYKTIQKMHPNVKQIVTSLGVGAHLEYWGIDTSKITELDWWQNAKIAKDIEITATPARHFSGRLFKRGKTLWSSFVLKIHGFQIFIGGDSGYDTHFKTINEKFGTFDIAFLECGQYGENWPLIHTFPEQTVLAAKDLKTKVLFPVHWGKFALANHDWNEPIKKLIAKAKQENIQYTTPKIGEMIQLNTALPTENWWDF